MISITDNCLVMHPQKNALRQRKKYLKTSYYQGKVPKILQDVVGDS